MLLTFIGLLTFTELNTKYHIWCSCAPFQPHHPTILERTHITFQSKVGRRGAWEINVCEIGGEWRGELPCLIILLFLRMTSAAWRPCISAEGWRCSGAAERGDSGRRGGGLAWPFVRANHGVRPPRMRAGAWTLPTGASRPESWGGGGGGVIGLVVRSFVRSLARSQLASD